MTQKKNAKFSVKSRNGFSTIQTILILSVLITLIGSTGRIFSINIKNAKAVQNKSEISIAMHNVNVIVDAAVESEIHRIFDQAKAKAEKESAQKIKSENSLGGTSSNEQEKSAASENSASTIVNHNTVDNFSDNKDAATTEKSTESSNEELEDKTSDSKKDIAKIANEDSNNQAKSEVIGEPEKEKKRKAFIDHIIDELRVNHSAAIKKIDYNIQSIIAEQENLLRDLGIKVAVKRSTGTAKIQFAQLKRPDGKLPSMDDVYHLKFSDLTDIALIEKSKVRSSRDLMLQVPIQIIIEDKTFYITRNYYLDFDEAILKDENFDSKIHLIVGETNYARLK